MRKLAIVVLMAPLCFILATAPAQETSGGIIFSRYRQFKIPFNAGAGSGRLKQLQLFMSTDQGRSWQSAGTAPPEQGHFRFTSERDGYFWFTVQTLDGEGRLYPQTQEGAAPSLKVVVDTQPPVVNLQALAPRGNEIGVSWTVTDDNLDLSAADAARLEYHASGSASWLPVTMPAGGKEAYWTPQASGAVEARLRVRDRAGNVGEATVLLNAAGSGFVNTNQAPMQQPVQPFAVAPQSDSAQQIFNGPGDNERKLVRSKWVSLNYEIKEKGPSGVKEIELWYTQDGRTWTKYLHQFGEDANQKNFVWEVAADGIYGITLLARSGVDLGDPPPRTGDRPQMWIEVDTVKPEVQLHNVLVGTGPDKGKLKVSWSARDKNLERNPIRLSFAQQFAGPWTEIEKNLPNNGLYVWAMPKDVPYQFHLRVEAVDRAGNIGEAITESLVKVDLSLPKVKILDVGSGR